MLVQQGRRKHLLFGGGGGGGGGVRMSYIWSKFSLINSYLIFVSLYTCPAHISLHVDTILHNLI